MESKITVIWTNEIGHEWVVDFTDLNKLADYIQALIDYGINYRIA